MAEHKAGFVSIIGKPNAGKSTLLNSLMGEQLAITTPKPQTTRHRILGILNTEDYQIVLSDTPGIIDPHYKLQESMMTFVKEALSDSDVLVILADVTEELPDKELMARLQMVKIPKILALNKVDDTTPEKLEKLKILWQEGIDPQYVIPISALHGFQVPELLNIIIELLPEHAPYYPKNAMTDRPERFFVTEMIREKILLQYRQEVPYSTEVEIETWQDQPEITKIRALIYVNRKSQKPILIGKGGEKLKKLGTAARKDIELFLQKKVYLELFVKIKEDWRENPNQLKRFGY